MILLDTNVLSALMQQFPDQQVVTWLDSQPRNSVWTTSFTVFEVRFGLLVLPAGKRRATLIEAFDELLKRMEGRIAPFDAVASEEAAALMATRRKKGRPGDLRDTMIAAIALAQHATLATRNTVHFEDVAIRLVNPWAA